MGIKPIGNAELGLTEAGWEGKAPLWYYILAESALQQGGRRLGEVGGRIVADVILGILDVDRDSYLHVRRGWKPTVPSGVFRMGELLKFAGAA
jgi:hypothetical protein